MGAQVPLPVAIDVGPLYGHRTGVAVATEGMMRAVGARDDIDLLPYLVSFRSEPRSGHRKLPLPGIVASHLWSRVDRPRADRWLRGAELLHGTNYVAPPAEIPTVISVYDCWFLEHPDRATPLVRRAGEQLRRAVDRGAWLHVSSEATATLARTLLDAERVVPILLGPPPTFDAERRRPMALEPVAGEPFVLAIGSEERRKGVPRLVRAFTDVAEARIDVHLVLAGAPGDDSASIDAAIEALPQPARDRIHRLGPVDEAAKHWLLDRATLLAYPSLDEGFGFPVLEAQAARTPVVATAVGSIPEVAGDGALLVSGDDELAEAIVSVLADEAARQSLIEAGDRNRRRFSWDTTATALVGLYHRMLEEGR